MVIGTIYVNCRLRFCQEASTEGTRGKKQIQPFCLNVESTNINEPETISRSEVEPLRLECECRFLQQTQVDSMSERPSPFAVARNRIPQSP